MSTKYTPEKAAVVCPQCFQGGRIVSLSNNVTHASCKCGNRWTTHTSIEMLAEAEAMRATAIAKATGEAA